MTAKLPPNGKLERAVEASAQRAGDKTEEDELDKHEERTAAREEGVRNLLDSQAHSVRENVGVTKVRQYAIVGLLVVSVIFLLVMVALVEFGVVPSTNMSLLISLGGPSGLIGLLVFALRGRR